mmetsp:Transcript_10220/g.32411  ORF Transcript_10220/g.32411 Transcript_10220/m.32411 type:complete len:248 (+) Transcript_10220:1274-2017(+)
MMVGCSTASSTRCARLYTLRFSARRRSAAVASLACCSRSCSSCRLAATRRATFCRRSSSAAAFCAIDFGAVLRRSRLESPSSSSSTALDDVAPAFAPPAPPALPPPSPPRPFLPPPSLSSSSSPSSPCAAISTIAPICRRKESVCSNRSVNRLFLAFLTRRSYASSSLSLSARMRSLASRLARATARFRADDTIVATPRAARPRSSRSSRDSSNISRACWPSCARKSSRAARMLANGSASVAPPAAA